MTRLALFALLAACSREPSEGFPINPGGGGGVGSSFRPDAPSGGDAGSTITGHVCLIVIDPQTLATCAATGAGNLTVVLGSAMTTTADDGAFTLMPPAVTTGLVWRVSGVRIVGSAIKFGTSTTLPALDVATYQDMLAITNATIAAGSGALIAQFTRGGFAVSGATVTSLPAPDGGQIFYDGPSATEWQVDATGTHGVAWMPSIAPGNATLTVTSGQTATTLDAQAVFADTITYVFAQIP